MGLRMVVVARTIERIGDRAVDIGEQTAYLLTAAVPRVHGRLASRDGLPLLVTSTA